LLRTHKFEENISTAVKELYPIEHATTLMGDDAEGISEKSDPEALLHWLEKQAADGPDGDGKEGKKAKKKLTLKMALANRGSGFSKYGAEIIHHCLLHAEIDPGRKVRATTRGSPFSLATGTQPLHSRDPSSSDRTLS
jgi:hypothetical protein